MKRICNTIAFIATFSLSIFSTNSVQAQRLLDAHLQTKRNNITQKDTIDIQYIEARKQKNIRIWRNGNSPYIIEEYLQLNDSIFYYIRYNKQRDILTEGELKKTLSDTKDTIFTFDQNDYSEKHILKDSWKFVEDGKWIFNNPPKSTKGNFLLGKKTGKWEDYIYDFKETETHYINDSILSTTSFNWVNSTNNSSLIKDSIIGEWFFDACHGSGYYRTDKDLITRKGHKIHTDERWIYPYTTIWINFQPDNTLTITMKAFHSTPTITLNSSFSISEEQPYSITFTTNEKTFIGTLQIYDDYRMYINFEQDLFKYLLDYNK